MKIMKALIAILLSTNWNGFGGGQGPKCKEFTIEVPVYDEQGNRLQYSVEAVVPTKYSKKEENEPGWLAMHGFKPTIDGVRVSGLSYGEYNITLRGAQGAHVKRQITVFLSCFQRHSQVVVNATPRGSIGDVAHDAVDGRLTGCSFRGDWWVRLVPIQGQGERSYEGPVLTDGRFEIPSHLMAARYALLIGFERDVILTTMVNLRRSDKNTEIGQIDLKAVCPNSPSKTR
jgi:hypothetical protein